MTMVRPTRVSKTGLVSFSQGQNQRAEEENSLCSATTLKINTSDSTSTTTGSTFRPGDSSVYSRSMVLLEPPAPAARVLLGRALAIFSFWSAAARRRMAERAPPGGGGDAGRDEDEPVAAPAGGLEGEEARGEDCWPRLSMVSGEAGNVQDIGRGAPVLLPMMALHRNGGTYHDSRCD